MMRILSSSPLFLCICVAMGHFPLANGQQQPPASEGYYSALSPDNYPWDWPPPSKCKTDPTSTSRPECNLKEDWPSFKITCARLQKLFNTEQFGLFDKALGILENSKQRFQDGVMKAAAAGCTLDKVTAANETTQAYSKDALSKWRLAVPNSNYEPIAEALSIRNDAWIIRGGGYSNTVSDESWGRFYELLNQAEEKLESFKGKRTPGYYRALLTITSDSKNPKESPRAVFLKAIKKYPYYHNYYTQIMWKLEPKWGGSWEDIDTFINYWAKAQKRVEGNSLYANLYMDLMIDLAVPPNETQVNWEKMKVSFSELIQRYPSIETKTITPV